MAASTVSVVIVGAGVAGLSTARHLLQAGFSNVTVLEASSRIGGRIKSVSPREGEGVVELGATCIHGATMENPVYALAKEWGLADSCTTVDRIAGQYYQEDGSTIDHSLVEQVWELFKEMEVKMDDLIRSKKPHGESAGSSAKSCAEFVQEERSAIESKFPDGKQREEASHALNSMLNYMRFMIGNELTKISADLSGKYKTIPGRDAMFSGKGYNAFVEHLRGNIPDEKILFNRKVSKIVWGGYSSEDGDSTTRKAKVVCENGEEYAADHVVVTCPLGHLKANYQKMFDPPLPESKVGAINRTGFGRVTKLFIYYDKPFWREGIKLAWSSDEYEITRKSDWAKRIVGFATHPNNHKTLGGPFAGTGAEIIETLSDEEVATTCRDVLRKFLNDQSVPSPTMVLRSSWNTDPLYLGSYSYPSTESQEDDIDNLILPLPSERNPVVLFAGEATHPCFYSTVHGAYLTGVREADRISAVYNA